MPGNVMDGLEGFGTSVADIFISLSAEYPAMLDIILVVFFFFGFIISCTAVFDIVKLGRPEQTFSGAGKITAKFLGGAMLMELAFWSSVIGATLWSETDPLGMEEYSASGQSDYASMAMMAAIGIIVLAGYVVLGRAFLGITRLGTLQPEARSDMLGYIISRAVAGSLMVACLHLAKSFQASAGFNWLPT